MPGNVYLPTVHVVFVFQGNIADFDRTAFVQALWNRNFSGVHDILCTAVQGSVMATTDIIMTDSSSAQSTQSTISATNVATMQTEWFQDLNGGAGLTLASPPDVLVTAISVASPPPSPLLPPPPSLPPLAPPPCPDGYYFDFDGVANGAFGSNACLQCEPGYYCPPGRRMPCPGGTVRLLPQASTLDECETVPAGYYAPLGSSEPTECPVDGSTFSCSGGESTPTITEPVSTGFENICPAGFESVELGTGATECTICRPGHYCLGGIAIRCPVDTWHNPATDRLVPKQSNASSCSACPGRGVRCDSGDQLVILQGFWMASPNASTAYQCAWYSACPGDRPTFADTSCAPGHKGVLCGRCDSGYYRGRKTCLACSDFDADARLSGSDSISVLVPAAVLCALLITLVLEPPACLTELLSRCIAKARSMGTVGRRLPEFLPICAGLFKICLSYSQCLGAISRFPRVRWPNIFVTFMATLDELNVELFALVPPECLAGTRLGFYWEMLALLSLPIMVVAAAFSSVLAMRWAAGRFHFRPKWRDPCGTGFRLRDNTHGWRGLKKAWNAPQMYKLLTWFALIMYPSICRKSLAIFDCVEAGEDEDGFSIWLMRDDPVLPDGRCYTAQWAGWVAAAGFGLVAYCFGVPLGALYLSGRYHYFGKHGDFDYDERERVTLLVNTYEEKYWYCESLSLLHRFFFTGVIHLALPETRVQIWFGVIVSLFVFVSFQLTLPYHYDICDSVQSAAFLQLLLTYISAFLFFNDGGDEVVDVYGVLGSVLVLINSGCFITMVAGAWINIYRTRKTVSLRRLRYASNHKEAQPRPLSAGLKYHVFLSHVWGTGQDQVRIIKERLLETFPPSSLEIFLDVDEPDLQIGDLEGYIERSDVVLVLATHGYFESKNCLRELHHAVALQKQMICVVEPEAKKGGLTITEIKKELGARAQLCLNNELVPQLQPPTPRGQTRSSASPCIINEWLVAAGDSVSAGERLCTLEYAPGQGTYGGVVILAPFTGKILSIERTEREYVHYGDTLLHWCDPDGVVLADALFEHEPIEWNRFGVRAAVAMRAARTDAHATCCLTGIVVSRLACGRSSSKSLSG